MYHTEDKRENGSLHRLESLSPRSSIDFNTRLE